MLIYIEIVGYRVEQRVHEVLLRVDDDAALESVSAARTEAYLRRGILNRNRRQSCGINCSPLPDPDRRCARNNAL